MVAKDHLGGIRSRKWIVGKKKRPPEWIETLKLNFEELAKRYVLVIFYPHFAERVRLLGTTERGQTMLVGLYIKNIGAAIVGPMIKIVSWSSRDKTG